MDTKTLVVGQKIWLHSGTYTKEATVRELGRSHMYVELAGEEGRCIQFRINGKPGTIFEKNRQWWQEEGPAGTEFGPWELVP